MPSVSNPETAPVESAENGSSSSEQQSSLTTVSTPPIVSSLKYSKRARKAPDTNWNFHDLM